MVGQRAAQAVRQLTGKLLRSTKRFEKLLAKEPAPGPRASGSAGEGQDGSFGQPDSRNGGDAPMDVEACCSDAVRAPEVAVPSTPGGEKRVNPSPEGEESAEAKKPKAESPSRKREAEGPPEAPEEEMVAGS